ncbi:MAG: hypothetical protein U0271_39110 [Polyangiaceae bacterium]
MTNMSVKATVASLLALALSACDAGPNTRHDPPPGDDPPDPTPVDWEPAGPTGECNVDSLLEPHAYGAKVKTLLTGLPLTDEELVALDQDPDALKPMIEGWLALPEATQVLERFFMLAFQQTNGDTTALFTLFGRSTSTSGFFKNPTSPRAHEMLLQSFAESLARTAARFVKEGRSFSEVLTTNELELTTAEAALLAYIDDEIVDDEGARTVRTTAGDFDTIKLVRDKANAPPLEEALDPTSPSFGTFWQADLAGLTSCGLTDTTTIDTTQTQTGKWRLATGVSPSYFAFSQMVLGRHQTVVKQGSSATCTATASSQVPLLSREDFYDYHRVTIRQPADGEATTKFYDFDTLRHGSELVLRTPRYGLLTSPGFLASWVTNEDNSARVTINQALIVALGKSFEGVAVSNFSPETLDAEHAPPDSECYGCHQTLDPMRDFYRASFTNFYGPQLDEERASLQADFVFGGVTTKGSGLGDLAAILASHPEFPKAWAEKLCSYANSAPCPEGAELDRVVTAFKESGLDFRVLLTELFASPLVTGSDCAAGMDEAPGASIARRSTFCATLSNRLGVEDLCGIRTHERDASTLQNEVRGAVASVPDDTFSRAVVEPVTIRETSMFTRANGEAACVQASLGAFDLVYGASSTDDATLSMTEDLMGLAPSDPRHDEALAILRDHVKEALAAGKTEEDAIESAFVIACMSPSVAGVGF